MNNSKLIDLIAELVEKRFIVVTDDPVIETLKSLAPDGLTNKDVVRLQRIVTGTLGWRTFVIATVESSSQITLALEWSAFCKEELLDPES